MSTNKINDDNKEILRLLNLILIELEKIDKKKPKKKK
jgi:hypothetical protein